MLVWLLVGLTNMLCLLLFALANATFGLLLFVLTNKACLFWCGCSSSLHMFGFVALWFLSNNTQHCVLLQACQYGCGSQPMIPFWGRCTTHFSLFSGDTNVHWGTGLSHVNMSLHLRVFEQQLRIFATCGQKRPCRMPVPSDSCDASSCTKTIPLLEKSAGILRNPRALHHPALCICPF